MPSPPKPYPLIGPLDGESSMSKGGKPKDVFDVERIREIIELMEQHDLCEVDLQQGDEKIKLNRGPTSADVCRSADRPLPCCRAGADAVRDACRAGRAPRGPSRSTPPWSARFTRVRIPIPNRS